MPKLRPDLTLRWRQSRIPLCTRIRRNCHRTRDERGNWAQSQSKHPTHAQARTKPQPQQQQKPLSQTNVRTSHERARTRPHIHIARLCVTCGCLHIFRDHDITGNQRSDRDVLRASASVECSPSVVTHLRGIQRQVRASYLHNPSSSSCSVSLHDFPRAFHGHRRRRKRSCVHSGFHK